MRTRLEEALREGSGIVALQEWPDLAPMIRAARERDELTMVMRGIYAATAVARSFSVRLQALSVADPDAILVSSSAAVAHGWLEPEDGLTVFAASRRLQTPRPGFRFTRSSVPHDEVVQYESGAAEGARDLTARLRATSPALTALDLAKRDGSDAIDTALRQGVELDALWSALATIPRRAGNEALRTLLAQSRSRPWSAAERAGHLALNEHPVNEWRANRPVPRDDGNIAVLDVAFKELRLGIEIDGYEHHHSHESFVSDRLRDVELAMRGWHIVRMSAGWVLDAPDRFALSVAGLVRQRAALMGHDPATWLG